ncbi:chromosome segregation protein SMC [Corynebacterium sp. 13CS0277]|uniref:chromosome segregation protein SMC n=1 Tax=Corynebacterium sp. 13CS0277 TaxID=2071994 RepID=UPI000D025BB5|nr:chromosome segregation protein SMC [Corynebacterium sp. 13CS0277]PRQ12536.1 chromosome segregation protein SMC [Corynebacterium sp. 13CS0277]
MHLKSLTLKGFKSFASATTLKFEPGICAVVGPNGSGKSNVVDALAWVMGEQGAKTLRGGKMEDVIFAGAGDRKPLGRAEVTLTIDNTDGALPIDYTEVSVTRRMFRDGASEYEINGAKARLMDIQELLSDSGIGREMHVIVGQGRLASILEARPEDRRAFIEEAAGVLKHRRRKEKAQRKLAGMQTNLDRLQDLTDELGKQLKPLARQAEAASKAATVQAELRAARLALGADKVVRLRAAHATAARTHEDTAARAETAQVRAQELVDARDALDAEAQALHPEAERAQQAFFHASALAERVAATGRVAAERATHHQESDAYHGPDPEALKARAERAAAEAEHASAEVEVAASRLEAIQDEVEVAQDAADAADREHLAQLRAIADRREGVVRLVAEEESLTARVQQATQQRTQVEQEVADIVSRVAALSDSLGAAEAAVARAAEARAPLQDAVEARQSEVRAAQARLEDIRSLEREAERTVSRLESRIDTLQAQMPKTDAQEVLGEGFRALSEALEFDPDIAPAVAAALGAAATGLVGPLGEELVDELEHTEMERTVLIDGDAGTTDQVATWNIDATLPAGCQWLHEHVTVTAGARPVARLLADVVLADTPAAARAAVAADERLRAVTRTGTVVGAGWATVGQSAPTPVDVAGSIHAARAELEVVSRSLRDHAGTLAGATSAAEDVQVRLAAAQAQLHEHDLAQSAAVAEDKRIRSELELAQRQRARAEDKLAQATEALAAAEQQLHATRDRLARVEDTDEPDEPTTAERDAAHDTLAQLKAMEVEARLAVRTAEDRAEHARQHAAGLGRQAQHEAQAAARHREQVARRAAAARLARVVADLCEDIGARAAIAVAQAQQRRDDIDEQRRELATELARAKDQASSATQEANRLAQATHEAEIALSQAEVRLEQAETTVAEQLGLPVDTIVAEHAPDDTFDRAATQAAAKKAEKDLAALGKVNPLALEEYKALQERYDFLATQLADVEQARRDLQQVIVDVDAKILQLFTDAWVDVERAFPQVFATLFPGGEGRLELTDPDDMLTTGIEVHARPPGKRVTRLSLLSGGEKSLTALALLVAIFKARPSPFYVMDEVEAALDDVNLRRLINLFEELRASSQLIVITHQKPTMDVANVLYGVTMRGDGVTRVISQRMNPVIASDTNAPAAGDGDV